MLASTVALRLRGRVEECRSFTDRQPWITLFGIELVFARSA